MNEGLEKLLSCRGIIETDIDGDESHGWLFFYCIEGCVISFVQVK